MEIEKLRDACEDRPFHPFEVLLADGKRVGVPHPEFASLAPEGGTVVIWRNGFPKWIDVPSIIAIDFQPRTQRRPKSAR
jgi:hypothetical protein